jgi:RPA family protein
MREREPAIRITTPEILGIDRAVQHGEENTKYGLSELGLMVNRFLLGAIFLSKMNEEDRLMVKVKDSFNELLLYVGDYYSESIEALEDLHEGDNLLVIGKVWVSSSAENFTKKFFAENIIKTSESYRKYAEAKAVSFLNRRIKIISRAISTGVKTENELALMMESRRGGIGMAERFSSAGSIDVEKFSALVEEFVLKNLSGTRDAVLDEIKKFREVSVEELAERMEGKVQRNELEEYVRELLLDGEIMEVRTGVYRYVP